ncbi:MAG: OmpA family protein [Nitrospiraceae bacterium]
MLRPHPRSIRTLTVPAFIILCATTPIGCVSTETHTKALTELDAARKTSAQQSAELDELKKQAQAQAQQLSSLQQNLDQETTQRQAAEQQAASLAKEREALTARSNELQARLNLLEEENSELNTELGNVRHQITDLEQEVARGNASAQEEISQLQKRASDLEADVARVTDEREQLRQEQSRLTASLEQERQRLKEEEANKARLAQEQSQLTASLEQERQRLKAEEAEKARLERERAAKEDEIRRLTSTQEALSKSLQDEIAKGNVTIQRVRDRLTINMVDRILFDSGQAQIKPAGVKVLKQVGDVLKTVSDKQIRIEGHTDNVPISTKLQDRFKTNWELSTARATTVVRYLIDHGGVNRQNLSAAGYADTRALASNDSEEGRSSNRRIEIVLYPRDLEQLAGQLEQGTAMTQ